MAIFKPKECGLWDIFEQHQLNIIEKGSISMQQNGKNGWAERIVFEIN